ncbi:Calbindin-32 [Chionoecetes opilio]|uniref:Calbindin-32 n=1 Tax=Chionoecetes opilio TaxID=41210 RepID=A0A8J4XNA4_CHIOP|nr:Calbindin-32 [Chionoecetes opilio]
MAVGPGGLTDYQRKMNSQQKCNNFMRQFRDDESRELKKLTANQFMEVWSHYDADVQHYVYRQQGGPRENTHADGVRHRALNYTTNTLFKFCAHRVWVKLSPRVPPPCTCRGPERLS